MERSDLETRRRRAERILAGLPGDVMDSCVSDMAAAVVAMLLSEPTLEADEGGDASGDLR
jgi:hypothetical protein